MADVPVLFRWPMSRGTLYEFHGARAISPEEGPWRVLVISQLSAGAERGPRGDALARVVEYVFRVWPARGAWVRATRSRLVAALRPLGLPTGRADRLIRLASAYPAWAERHAAGEYARTGSGAALLDVLALPGCGGNAIAAWALFVDGRLDGARPADPVLGLWWEWATQDAAMVAAAAVPPPGAVIVTKRKRALRGPWKVY